MSENPSLTHFGFQSVAPDQKTRKVQAVFTSVAPHYDLMNDLMSLGIHRQWKRRLIQMANLKPHQHLLDLAGGTGDIAFRMAQKLQKRATIVLADINEKMLRIAQDHILDNGLIHCVQCVQANAEELPFSNNSFDRILISFGFRNITYQSAALKNIYASLNPGGSLLILEFSHPHPWFQKGYDLYSFSILPRLGRVIAKDEASYRYLVESIRKHPNQSELCRLLEEAGFEGCTYHNLSGGIVAIHRGYKY